MTTGDEYSAAPAPILERAFTPQGDARSTVPVRNRVESASPQPVVTDRVPIPVGADSDATRAESPTRFDDWNPQPFVVDIAHDERPPLEPRRPTPLLDSEHPARTQTATAIRPDTRNERVSSAERDREPTEVHVHIGRIDITAENAPAPVRSLPAPGRKAASLADYLAKRQPRGP